MYDYLFGDRDPVAEPGTESGSPGDWWTVFANVPDILEHAVQGFGVYRSPKRKLDPVLRELGQTRVGWAAESLFVFSQHCKSLRALGVSDERIAAIPHWQAADCFSEVERLVL
ncbi:MAG TPA: carboxymuconolactone decarboxylase family protein, partial [Acidimicrobiales bacterium]|nr:carboxymuconolactone decarboxylase family protein [Acidimicrobiales bacterium]